jgi:hypothetical protein
MIDTGSLLNYRLVASIIICAFFVASFLVALYQVIARHKNGVYISISFVCLITAALFGVFIFISYMDVCDPSRAIIRNWILLTWDIIITLLPISFIILGVQFVRSAD